jgi:tetratricopeptide (TPR) repeat protein
MFLPTRPVTPIDIDIWYSQLDLLGECDKLSLATKAIINELTEALRGELNFATGKVYLRQERVVYCISRLENIRGVRRGENARINLEEGRAFYKIEMLKKAENTFREAANHYQSTAYHEYAVASIILAQVLWVMGDYNESLISVDRACVNFKVLRDNPQKQEPAREHRDWYIRQIDQLERLMVYLAQESK